MINEITKILQSFTSKWICLLTNGTIISTSLDDNSLNKIKTLSLLKRIISNPNANAVGSVVFFSDLIIYRPTEDFFIFLIGRYTRNIIKEKLTEISQMYEKLDKEFKKQTKSKKFEIKLALFSMVGENGPESTFYYPHNFNQDEIIKISTKSLLTLLVEHEGAKTDMISFLPFIDIDSLGIIYLFQIKDSKARGGSYDSAITILVDYKFRAIIYENYKLLEKALKEVKDGFEKEYYTTKDYKMIIDKVLKKHFRKISFETVEVLDIKDEMMEEIKKLATL